MPSGALSLSVLNSSAYGRVTAAVTVPSRDVSGTFAPPGVRYRMLITYDPELAESIIPSYRPGPTWRSSTGWGLPFGPTALPVKRTKFCRSPLGSSASTMILVLSPISSVVTRMSAFPPGRMAQRTCCSQNALYLPHNGHAVVHFTEASDVNATLLPSPYCQCARIGSFSLPRSVTIESPSRSAETMYPEIGGSPTPVNPRIGSLEAFEIVGLNASPSQISDRFTTCASLIKIDGSLANSPSSMIE